ncbi:hypothetical protein [Aurantimonas sp. VKM B-3413]|uniref:hypothetical protein n=1 Tax=Aurantimonas sp. VKM B-3413 TaxID=2779401 RepID=UPI001E322593|nr:hypothetical protein [Aurantimonas sp. VKM B-3413]MCB8838171.1 hypothetical protein [Aurantimonas sp. VKM B-3413]
MAKQTDSTNARQGSRGTPVLIVLIVALVLIVLGYLLTGWIGYSTQPDQSISTTETVGSGAPTTSASGTGEVTPSDQAPSTSETVVRP